MSKLLYLDCSAGASGDMILGALVDVGAPLKELRSELSKLNAGEFRVVRSRARRGGVSGTRIRVETPFDRGYRRFSDFERAIRKSKLEPAVRETSLALLWRLFEAEAGVHGTSPETIHLHELGSLDTLVDVVGAVLGVELLDLDEILSSPVNVGGGFVETEHGRMTVPAPATALLLRGALVFSDGEDFERTTPTGALLVTGLAKHFGPWPAMTLRRIGYGLGEKDARFGRANALRVALGERRDQAGDVVLVLETTVDDMTPEQVGYLHERLLDAPILDVFLTPVQMKKGRPGVNVSVLTRPEAVEAVKAILFAESTSLGVRTHEVTRETLERRLVSVSTAYGKVRVKEAERAGRAVNAAPEFEDCRRLAAKRKVSLKEVQQAALAAYRKTKGS